MRSGYERAPPAANMREHLRLLGLLAAKSDTAPPPASSRSEPYPKPKFPVAKFPLGTEEERRAYFRNALLNNSVPGWKAPPPELVDDGSVTCVMKYMDAAYPAVSAAAKQASADLPEPFPIPGPPKSPNPARQTSTAAPTAETEDQAIQASIAEAEACRAEWLEIQARLKAEQAEAERQAEEGRQALPSQAEVFAAACEANAQAGDYVELSWAEEKANELCGGMAFDSREDMLNYLAHISHQGNGEAEAVRLELLREQREPRASFAASPAPATPPDLAAPTTPKPLYKERESEETLKLHESPQSFDYDRVHAPAHGAAVSPAQGSLGSASLQDEISLADGTSLPAIGSPQVYGGYLKRARTQPQEESFDMAKDDSEGSFEEDTFQAADSLEAELNAMQKEPEALDVFLAVRDALRPDGMYGSGYAGLARNLPTLPDHLQWKQSFHVPELFVIESKGAPLPSDQGHWLAKQDDWSFPEQCAWAVLMDSCVRFGDIMIHTRSPEALPTPTGYIWNRLPPLKLYYMQGGGQMATDHFDRVPTHRLELQ